jgi:hypothetical protein
MTDFAQAKNYLITNIITQFGWEHPTKRKKAKWFIAQVQRRFQ